jgi:protein ImuA
MRPPGAAEGLSTLKRRIAALEGVRAPAADGWVPLGLPAIDAALGGGLARDALHEIAPAGPLHRGAALGFAVALAGRALDRRRAGDVLWIEAAFAAAETGRPYGPGFDGFGLSSSRLLIVRVPRGRDALWAMEEALPCRGIAATVAEVTEQPDLTATRRLSLAARAGGGLALMLPHRVAPHPTAALTRWRIAAAPSSPDAFGGLGHAAFDLTLTKNRHGPCGRWTVLWDHHERAFREKLSVGVARAPFDRPAALRRAG